MADRLPIKAAKDVSTHYDLRQVILLAWDGELTHIVTYGKSADDCAQAAAGGNMLKAKWGWPECNGQPSRVKRLRERVEALETALKDLSDNFVPEDDHYGSVPILTMAAARKLL